MPTTAKTPPAKKTTAKRAPTIRKGTAPRGAKPAAAKTPAKGAGSKGGQLNGSTVRHGKFADPVWQRAEERAAREGRGVWEVLRQKLAEYADELDVPRS